MPARGQIEPTGLNRTTPRQQLGPAGGWKSSDRVPAPSKQGWVATPARPIGGTVRWDWSTFEPDPTGSASPRETPLPATQPRSGGLPEPPRVAPAGSVPGAPGPASYVRGPKADYGPTRQLCEGCAERQECLEFALADDSLIGLWGGTTDAERGEMRRQRVA